MNHVANAMVGLIVASNIRHVRMHVDNATAGLIVASGGRHRQLSSVDDVMMGLILTNR